MPFVLLMTLLAAAQDRAPLSNDFARIAAASGGHAGAYAEVLESGESASVNDRERFPMQSVTLPNGRQAAIAVFIKDSTADETTRAATIAKIAQAAWNAWAGR
jgi:hypothetical protein